MKKELNYVACGDGDCPITEYCSNYHTSYCDVCMYNTGATTRDFFYTDNEKEQEFIDENQDELMV